MIKMTDLERNTLRLFTVHGEVATIDLRNTSEAVLEEMMEGLDNQSKVGGFWFIDTFGVEAVYMGSTVTSINLNLIIGYS